MSKIALPHDAFVFVGDGRKALFLRNEGDEKYANLVTERVLKGEVNPPSHEQGSDRPGRVYMSAGVERRAVPSSRPTGTRSKSIVSPSAPPRPWRPSCANAAPQLW